MALNLEKQLLFVRLDCTVSTSVIPRLIPLKYGSYHHDPVNIAIHVTCVPLILLTAFLFGTNTPAIPCPEWLTVPGLPLNLGTISALVYSSFYILMEPVAGSMLAPLLLGATAYSKHLTSEYGMRANYIAIAVHVFSWIAQFVGHGVFEGRAPALLDNLVQAIFLAPFFVWLEILFVLGYRPELRARLDASVQTEISKFRSQKQATGTANGKPNGHVH